MVTRHNIGYMLVAKNHILSFGQEAFKRTVKSVIKQRYFPEIWYLSESWLQMIKGRRVLIVGYGLGLLGEAFARLGWQVTLVDVSVVALADLRQRFDAGNQRGQFQHAVPEAIPFKDASFDAVLCVNVLEFCQDPRAVVGELDRLLIPGGHGVVATFNRFSAWGFSGIARHARLDDRKLRGNFLDRLMFEKLFAKTSLVVDSIICRANYLPIGSLGFKLRLPVAGAFVALVKKKA